MVLGRVARATFLLPLLTLVLPFVNAKSGFGEACSQDDTHLDQETWSIVTDCDSTTYCADNGTCAHRGCRSDIYPVGYNDVPYDQLPRLCPEGQFCPDESDKCLPMSPQGGPCQKDRDDQCAPAPNWRDLDGYLNVNGSVCLNFTCYYANVTVGQTCIYDNTPYSGFNDAGNAYSFIISRDNCANGQYCDGSTSQCYKQKREKEACTGNKECLSYNCQNNQKCGRAADEPIHPQPWVYALVALGIIGFIVGIFVGLWFMHRRWRTENQIKLEQYYNEQIAYRQSIMSMSHAKNALLAMPAQTSMAEARRFLYTDEPSPSPLGHRDEFLPPNMRRGDSGQWSETDSEMLLVSDQDRDRDVGVGGSRGRSERF